MRLWTEELVLLLILVVVVSAAVRFSWALFSSEMWERVVKHPVAHAIWFLTAFVIAVYIFYPRTTGHPPSKTRLAVRDCGAIKEAVESFVFEYHRYPLQANTNSDHLYFADHQQLMDSLMGERPSSNDNPRGIVFPDIRFASDKILDPWQHSYNVKADWDGDGKLRIGSTNIATPVAVWSNGPNGENEFGLGDDVTSWKW